MFKCCNCDSAKVNDGEKFDENENPVDILSFEPSSSPGADEKVDGTAAASPEEEVDSGPTDSPMAEMAEPEMTPAATATTTEAEQRSLMVKSFVKKASKRGVTCAFWSHSSSSSSKSPAESKAESPSESTAESPAESTAGSSTDFQPATFKIVGKCKEFAIYIKELEQIKMMLSEVVSCLTLEQALKANKAHPDMVTALHKVPNSDPNFLLLVTKPSQASDSKHPDPLPLLFKSKEEREGFVKVMNVLRVLK